MTVRPIGISTGVTRSPTEPTGTGSYTPILNYTLGGTGVPSPSIPVEPSYPYTFANSTVTAGPLSAGGSSPTAESSIPGVSNSTSTTADPSYRYTFSFPPSVPTSIGGPISPVSGLLPSSSNYSGYPSALLSTANASGITYAPLNTGGSSESVSGPISTGGVPYGNGTTVNPFGTSNPSTVYGYTLSSSTYTSPASTIAITETVSATLTYTSPLPASNITLGGTGPSGSSESTANVTSTIPYPSHGPYTPSSFPISSVTASPASSLVTGSSNSGNSPVQASNTTSPIYPYPTYPYSFDPTISAAPSVPFYSSPVSSAFSSPLSIANTTAGPVGASSTPPHSYTFTPTTFSTSTGSSSTSCNESSASTAAPVGFSSGLSSASVSPIPNTTSDGEAPYSYDPTSVTASVPTEYYRHHGRQPQGKKSHVS